jgi:RimJ/RimL family protein N-acetyltransferase
MLEIDESLKQTEPDCREGLGTPNLILRAPKEQDLAYLVATATNPTLNKNLCTQWLPVSMDAAKDWLYSMKTAATAKTATRKHETFVITDMKGCYCGVAALDVTAEKNKAREAELSVIVKQSIWGRGIATLAIQTLVDFAFSNPDQTPEQSKARIDTITVRCRVSCPRSRRITEKCGFQYCGTGMAHSPFYRGMIPVDRFHLDRGIWTALRHWGRANPRQTGFDAKPVATKDGQDTDPDLCTITPALPADPILKGAA